MSKRCAPDIQEPTKCRVCSRLVSLNSARHGMKYNIFKSTKCCQEHSIVHIKCAEQFCSIIDPSYEFDQMSYPLDDTILLYCFICEKKCFYCGSKHTVNNNDLLSMDMDVCQVCKKSWCYHIKKKCKNDQMSTMCDDCANVKTNDVAIPSSPPPKTNFLLTIEHKLEVYNSIAELIEFQFETNVTLNEWKHFVLVNFTHLDLILHNIFSPNTINTDKIKGGMFLSSQSLHLLLGDDNEKRVSPELYSFIVGALKFHQDIDNLNNEGSDEHNPYLSDDCSMRSLICMITKNEKVVAPAEIDFDHYSQLVLIEFISKIWDIVTPTDKIWKYEFTTKGFPRNDTVWKRLFASSNCESFNFDNLWQVFGDEGNKKKNKLLDKCLMGIVSFTDKHVNKWIEGGGCQILIGSGKGNVRKLNRLPVIHNGEPIDIVQEVQNFVAISIMESDLTFSSEKAKEDISSKSRLLKDHIMFCMKNVTTYIMCCPVEQDYHDGTTAKSSQIIGVSIVEQDIVMTKGEERPLIHYLVVHPEHRHKNIGTALLKIIMNQSEYYNKNIMAVTSLPREYGCVLATECHDEFFKKFDFKESVKVKKSKGENDVNALVLDGSGVSCVGCVKIRKAPCSYKNFQTNVGVYEFDNHTKTSICCNPHDNCIYGENVHFGWDKLDLEDWKMLPESRLEMVRDNIGHDIVLTGSGHRITKNNNPNPLHTLDDHIPEKYRQHTYEKKWLCLVICLSINPLC